MELSDIRNLMTSSLKSQNLNGDSDDDDPDFDVTADGTLEQDDDDDVDIEEEDADIEVGELLDEASEDVAFVDSVASDTRYCLRQTSARRRGPRTPTPNPILLEETPNEFAQFFLDQ